MAVTWGALTRRALAGVTLLATTSCGHAATRRAPPLVDAVLDALAAERPLVLRFASDARHASCPGRPDTSLVPSAACRPVTAPTLSRLSALSLTVRTALRNSATTDALWAAALIDLATSASDPRVLQRTVGRLREVVARDSGLALAYNHLAAAYLARAAARDDARDLFASLNAVEHAAHLDSLSAAIAYNRAAIHQAMGTHRRLRQTWGTAIERERASDWRGEASSRQADVRQPRPAAFTVTPAGVREYPQEARELVLDSLIPRWTRVDSAERRAILNHMHVVGDALLHRTGDSTVAHLLVELWPQDSGVVSGTRACAEGTLAYRRQRYADARRALERGERRLAAAGSRTLTDWCRIMLAATRMASRDHVVASRIAEDVSSRARERGDRSQVALALWVAAIARARAGEPEIAESMTVEARGVFHSLGEAGNAALMRTMQSDIQGLMGRSLDAARTAFMGITEVGRARGALRYEDLLLLAQQMGEEGLPWASRHLLAEALVAARESGRPKDEPEALGRLALAALAVGLPEEATAALTRALALATAIPDSAMRARLDAELHRAAAGIHRNDAARAIRHLEQSLAYFRVLPLDAIRLEMALASARLTHGDTLLAERHFASASRSAEGLVITAPPAWARELNGVVRDAQRMAIVLAMARGDTALAFAETRRLSSMGLGAPDDGDDDLARLGTGWAEARFVAGPDSVISWVRTPQGRSVAVAAMPRQQLTQLVVRFSQLVRTGDDPSMQRSLSRALYQVLLAPHEAQLTGVTGLALHLDGVLVSAPIGALTGADDRPLNERFELRHVVATRRPHASPGKVRLRVPLLVGDPAWRRSEHPALEPLQWADDEVRALAEREPGSTVLLGGDATRRAVLEGLQRHEALYFAGHAVVASGRQGRSHLVLAAGSSFGDGVLYASDIARLDLRGVRRVVLSSCGRAGGEAEGMEEVNELALAFLDAGVEEVVASLWELEDGPAVVPLTALAGQAGSAMLRYVPARHIPRN